MALVVKNPPANAGDVRDVGLVPGEREDPLEKGRAIHSSILAWRTPWTERNLSVYSPWGRSRTQLY